MIKASELRIGNLAMSNEIVEVEAFMLLPESKVVFEGIPITAEWLEKFGFKLIIWNDVVKHYYIYIMGEFCSLSFEFGQFKNFPNRLDQVVIGAPPFKSGTYYGKFNIEYLHQVQNLYFALTGKELILNKTIINHDAR